MKLLDLQSLYTDYGPEIRHYLKAKFGDGPPEPEDVVQAAFAKLAALADLSTVENPRAFLYAAARNITIDEHRKNARARRHRQHLGHAAPHEILDELTPERVLLSKESLTVMRAVVEALPAVQRDALLLRRFHGLTHAAIAARLGVSETSVRRHIADAMARLLKALRLAETGGGRARSTNGHGRDQG